MKRNATSTIDCRDIRRILNQDPAWSAYALADLQPAFAPHCHWYTGQRSTGTHQADEGVLLLFTALTPPILLTVGTPAVVERLLAEAELPERVFISARHEHVPLIEQHYRFDWPEQGTEFHRMVRMAFQRPTALAPSNGGDMVTRLGPADVARIEQLLSHGGPYTPDAFQPYQLEEGVFFGINGPGHELLAVGGTHIVDWQGGIGAVGNMYTHPAHRGQGYARRVLGAVVHTLRAGGIHNLILNVNEHNQSARRLYAQYGFDEHCGFAEGIGVMRKDVKRSA